MSYEYDIFGTDPTPDPSKPPPSATHYLHRSKNNIIRRWNADYYAEPSDLGYSIQCSRFHTVKYRVDEVMNEFWKMWQKDRVELTKRNERLTAEALESRTLLLKKSKEASDLKAALDFVYKRVDPLDTWHRAASKIAGLKRIIDAKKAKKALEKKRGLNKALEDISGNPDLSEEEKLHIKTMMKKLHYASRKLKN